MAGDKRYYIMPDSYTRSFPQGHNPNYARSHHPSKKYFQGKQNFKRTNLKQARQTGKIVVYGVPDKTTLREVTNLLLKWLPGITVQNCYIHIPRQCREDNTRTLLSFVTLQNDDEADAVVSYYHDYVKDFSTRMCKFTNLAGIQGDISIAYCYQEKSAKPVENSIETNNDYETCAKDIELAREQIISSIRDIEGELSKKVPDWFVSELEMYHLQNEEDEINRNNELKSEQIKVVKLELKEVREAKEKYDELSSNEDE